MKRAIIVLVSVTVMAAGITWTAPSTKAQSRWSECKQIDGPLCKQVQMLEARVAELERRVNDLGSPSVRPLR